MNRETAFAGWVVPLCFPRERRVALCAELARFGYGALAWQRMMQESWLPDALVADGRRGADTAFAVVRGIRDIAPNVPAIVIANPHEPFVYRRSLSVGRVVVLYHPVATSDLVESLDQVTAARPPRLAPSSWPRAAARA